MKIVITLDDYTSVPTIELDGKEMNIVELNLHYKSNEKYQFELQSIEKLKGKLVKKGFSST